MSDDGACALSSERSVYVGLAERNQFRAEAPLKSKRQYPPFSTEAMADRRAGAVEVHRGIKGT